ncbi:hypothetical protein DICPUDRAFT_154493 [Dictyostelium purpureum]|uniref:Uncharacterized protein n=1 Tax=Dictyostelium purpureum TaxID=5786 RepID=F0ZRH0_DICPU|nr:uncharacterized protein DICPUDRAFT_154493 [Dictyostelium purpureum]EGC33452.1 hypothetical protein DICPUDRAFT_154493 [Dictyostelium purpureum]|eukprot:XP_003290023.1 hypothetical protein DICPUDRAFT_154493 [Dictyostelium purpureum]
MDQEEFDYQEEEQEAIQFSILNTLKSEGEKEKVIQDLINLIRFFYHQINKSESNETKLELIKLYNMVLELLKKIQEAAESCGMMSNLFELYQVSDQLRYYFALFNGDIKMKLNNIFSTDKDSNKQVMDYFNKNDNINFESNILKSFLNNNNNNNDSTLSTTVNKAIELFNYNRNEINAKLMSIAKSDEEKEATKREIQDELCKQKESQTDAKQEEEEMINEKEAIEKSFFIMFQLFTSFLYNLQSLGEKSLLSFQDFSDSATDKQNLFSMLIQRDLVCLKSIIQLLKLLVNNNSTDNKNEDQYILNATSQIQYKTDSSSPPSSFVNLVQNVLLNYIEKNNLDEESILSYLNQ